VHRKRNPHFVADCRAVAALSKDQTERWHCFRINFGRDRARKSELFGSLHPLASREHVRTRWSASIPIQHRAGLANTAEAAHCRWLALERGRSFDLIHSKNCVTVST